ncbi:aldo/keto reductase [Georgenia deserti]|uniref:Aldo/keto reductase n=1 Tax=Georgenia deserti TaxID=2093781 RepID=A0ABW4L7R1_9MICO
MHTTYTPTHPFGRQAFGAMRLHEADTDSERDPACVIGAALDAGVHMIDTADAYGNEAVVGAAIAGRREEVLLASKFGLVWREEVGGPYDVRADPDYVQQAMEASLGRLGVEHLDLYYLHARSDEVPIEETVGAMAELVDQGTVGRLGLSNVNASDLRRAAAVHRIDAVQEQWSLVHRPDTDLLDAAREVGAVVVAHSPTGHGLLHDGGTSPALRAELDAIAREQGATRGQIALAWVHHRSAVHSLDVVPLPGTTCAGHVRENVAAAELTLTADQLARLDQVAEAPS